MLEKDLSLTRRGIVSLLLFFCCSLLSFSTFSQDVSRAVWVNEAIIRIYTFDFEHFAEQQKDIAKYFTAQGFISFSKALQNSKLPDVIKTQGYYVSAVATLPPVLKQVKKNEWEATMPILVVYKGAAHQQKQSLMVKLNFIEAQGQGVRGFAITSLQSTVTEPPCECAKSQPTAAIV